MTARFNRNVLAVINWALDVDTGTSTADIDMWLEAKRSRQVRIGALDLSADFAA